MTVITPSVPEDYEQLVDNARRDLEIKHLSDLWELAIEHEVPGYRKLSKEEIVDAIFHRQQRSTGLLNRTGLLDLLPDGFGFLRCNGYKSSPGDVYVSQQLVRAFRLRRGDKVYGELKEIKATDKFPALAEIFTVNDAPPETMMNRPKFENLTPLFPEERLRLETLSNAGRNAGMTARVMDILAPIGKGQRGLIVSPPKAGKTMVLKSIAQSIAENNPECHIICLLVDERPEEVTDMQRTVKGEVVYSTFDMPSENHTQITEMVLDRCKRLVELGQDVVVLLDSITRLARAYNLNAPASGRIMSGGVDAGALYPPKKFFGAARNIENGFLGRRIVTHQWGFLRVLTYVILRACECLRGLVGGSALGCALADGVEEVGVGSRVLQLGQQQLDCRPALELAEHVAQLPHEHGLGRFHQQLFAACARAFDIHCREDALVRKLAIEPDLHVAGALELLEDHLVHLGACINQRSCEDGQRATVLDVAGGTEEALRRVERAGVDATGEDAPTGRSGQVVCAAEPGDRVEQNDDVVTHLDEALGPLDGQLGDGGVVGGRPVEG